MPVTLLFTAGLGGSMDLDNMNRSELLFWKWVEAECTIPYYSTSDGIAYDYSNDWYISPIVIVQIVVNEQSISFSARVSTTDEENYEKYPKTSTWNISWDQLKVNGFKWFLEQIKVHAKLDLLRN